MNRNPILKSLLGSKARFLAVSALVAAFFGNVSTAAAVQIIFTIDPSQSAAVWSGNTGASFGFAPFVEQFPGSLSAPLSGHFLVDFDPTNSAPPTLQFIGGHGYYQVASSHVLAPGVGGGAGTAPGNFGGKTPGGEVYWAVRDLVWDFLSPAPINRAGGTYAANQTAFSIISGGMDFTGDHSSYSGSDYMSGGQWSLAESSPGSGDWTLSSSGLYYDFGDADATFNAGGYVVATAHYGTGNSTPVAPGPVQADALGGAGATGGISAQFDASSGGGTLSVQQVPNYTALSQAAIAAGEVNGTFSLSTAALSTNPQIWNVDFTGDLNGGLVTLVFNYDPALLPVGLDQSQLGIWHFNSLTGQWDFGGTPNPLNHTITYVTDSFSPFTLGLAVPEPTSALLAAIGLAGLAWIVRQKRSPR